MFGGSMTATETQARCVGTQHPSLHLTPSINPRSLSLPRALHGVVYIFFGVICRMKASRVKIEEASCWCPSAFRPSLFISGQMCCLPVVGPGVRGRSLFVCCPIRHPLPFYPALCSQLVPFEHLLPENCHQLDNSATPFSKKPRWQKVLKRKDFSHFRVSCASQLRLTLRRLDCTDKPLDSCKAVWHLRLTQFRWHYRHPSIHQTNPA